MEQKQVVVGVAGNRYVVEMLMNWSASMKILSQ
jgi:hypothetical protein